MEQTPIEQRRADDTPEIMKDRVRTYFEVSKAATDYYHRLGVVREVDAIGTTTEVYDRVKEVLKPNVVGVIGATGMGKTEFSKRFASHGHYAYIHAPTFFQKNKATTCEKKVKILTEFLFLASKKNFIIDDFPQTKKQAKIFNETFAEPLAIFNISAEKDEVYNRIDVIAGQNGADAQKLRDSFTEYLTRKDDLVSYLSS